MNTIDEIIDDTDHQTGETLNPPRIIAYSSKADPAAAQRVIFQRRGAPVRLVSESEFREKLYVALSQLDHDQFYAVTGPGRSGAIAAVYASHFLKIPFIPFGQRPQIKGRMLIVDTASQTGRTGRKAIKKYESYDPHWLHVYDEPPRVWFWYEECNPNPQRYRHETREETHG